VINAAAIAAPAFTPGGAFHQRILLSGRSLPGYRHCPPDCASVAAAFHFRPDVASCRCLEYARTTHDVRETTSPHTHTHTHADRQPSQPFTTALITLPFIVMQRDANTT